MELFTNNLAAYRELFIFENNLRVFIQSQMNNKYGPQWFNKVKRDIQSEFDNQKKQLISYLSSTKMIDSPLNYLFMSHLKTIINDEWNNIFYVFFKDVDPNSGICLNKVKNKLFEIEVIRNFLAHNHLIDDNHLIQLNANVNFFKKYMSSYNEHIYEAKTGLEYQNIIVIVKNIIKSVDKMENIEEECLSIIKNTIDNDLYNALKQYNALPKTRDKKDEIRQHLKLTNIKQKLSFLKGV
jgi:hypothetical protein